MAQRRRPIVGGNWKMNTDLASAVALAEDVAAGSRDLIERCDVAVFPPFPYLHAVGKALGRSGIVLGAQDVFYESNGAYTGEVSAEMLADLYVKIVLAGHSERRHVIGETDDLVNRKLHAALSAGLSVILCIGETLEQREAGMTDRINLAQLEAGLRGVARESMKNIVIAYEPVWAIGTGRTATPADAQSVHRLIRSRLAELHDTGVSQSARIQYGGSVKADNAAALAAQPDVDGFLVGGASLKAGEFLAILKAAGNPAAAPAPR